MFSKSESKTTRQEINYSTFPLRRQFRAKDFNKAIEWLKEHSKLPGFDFNQITFKKPPGFETHLPIIKHTEVIALSYLASHASTKDEVDFFLRLIKEFPELSQWREPHEGEYQSFTLFHYVAINMNCINQKIVSTIFIPKLCEYKHNINDKQNKENENPLFTLMRALPQPNNALASIIAKTLIMHGADGNCEDTSGLTTINMAYIQNQEIYHLLLNHGVKPNFNTIFQSLAGYGELDKIKKLLKEHGSIININYTGIDNSEYTPLMEAIQDQYNETAEYLLEQKADPSIIIDAREGKSNALTIATKAGNTSMITKLLAQKNSIDYFRNIYLNLIAAAIGYPQRDKGDFMFHQFLNKANDEKASDVLNSTAGGVGLLHFTIKSNRSGALSPLLNSPLLDVNASYKSQTSLELLMSCSPAMNIIPMLEKFLACKRVTRDIEDLIHNAIQKEDHKVYDYLLTNHSFSSVKLFRKLLKSRCDKVSRHTLQIIWNKMSNADKTTYYRSFLSVALLSSLLNITIFLLSVFQKAYLTKEYCDQLCEIAKKMKQDALLKKLNKLFMPPAAKESKNNESESKSDSTQEHSSSAIPAKAMSGFSYTQSQLGIDEAKELQKLLYQNKSIEEIKQFVSESLEEKSDTFFGGTPLLESFEPKRKILIRGHQNSIALIPDEGIVFDNEGKKIRETQFDGGKTLRFASTKKNIGFKKLRPIKINPSLIVFNNKEIKLTPQENDIYEYVIGGTDARPLFIKVPSDFQKLTLFLMVGYLPKGLHNSINELSGFKIHLKTTEILPEDKSAHTPSPIKEFSLFTTFETSAPSNLTKNEGLTMKNR